MTIWALALLASSVRAANVAPARAVAPAGGSVRAVPSSIVPSLGGGLGLAPAIGDIGLRGSLPVLPLPAPGLSLPTLGFAPPGAFQFLNSDAPVAAAAPAPAAEPQGRSPAAPAAPDVARRSGALVPEEPSSAAPPSGRIGSRADERGANGALLHGLARAGVPADATFDERSLEAGRGLFDNAVARPAIEVSRSAAPSRPASAWRLGLPAGGVSPRLGPVSPRSAPASGAAPPAAPASDLFAPDASLLAVRSPLPDVVAHGALAVDAALRDAVAAPRLAALDAPGAILRGGHEPLLLRPDRLGLSGEGLVVRVLPLAPPADAFMRGGPAWTGSSGASAPVRRLVSTDRIERGALLEAISASAAAAVRDASDSAVADGPERAADGLRRPAPRVARPPSEPLRRAPALPAWLALLPVAALVAARAWSR